jgi:hypothetical protein
LGSGLLATWGNAGVDMLTAPIMQFNRIDKERRRPVLLFLGLVCALAVVVAVSFAA